MPERRLILIRNLLIVSHLIHRFRFRWRSHSFCPLIFIFFFLHVNFERPESNVCAPHGHFIAIYHRAALNPPKRPHNRLQPTDRNQAPAICPGRYRPVSASADCCSSSGETCICSKATAWSSSWTTRIRSSPMYSSASCSRWRKRTCRRPAR